MRLPIGYDDFRKLIDNHFDFVDKTLLIKDIIDDSSEVILITRPRRFGKTLNLSMLQYFFAAEVHGEKTDHLFANLKISQADEEYLQHQGKYPVIFLTLKDVKDSNFAAAYANLQKQISGLYNQHHALLSNSILREAERETFAAILKQQASEADIANALKDLTYYLYRCYGVKPIILIDEYDSPIHSGYSAGYYDEIVDFMRNFLGAALKTNPYLHKAVLTGILRISKESLFSGLNNIEVYSLLRTEYSEYFGFTENEVSDLLTKTELTHRAQDIQRWYNGYQIGNTVIYNPWSIVNCLKNRGELQPYWINTSGNMLIKELVVQAGSEFKTYFECLLRGETIEKTIDENFVFGDLKRNDAAIWNLLLMTGYLKVIRATRNEIGELLCHLAVPNREIYSLYLSLIKEWLSSGYGIDWYGRFLDHLLKGEIEAFQEKFQEVLLRIVSVHDTAKSPEAFYHGFLLGLIVGLDEKHYIVKSNREAGYGRYDIAIIPKDATQLGILIECKATDNVKKLDAVARQALKQMSTKQYATELKQYGVQRILKLGIALCGKDFVLTQG